jgi:hypothetical protein
VLGGVSGTVNGGAAGAQSAGGQVNEFGQIEFSLPDGTQFTGQFDAGGASFRGTWTGPAGSGTFEGASATKPQGGTGGSSGTGGGPGATGGTGNVGPAPSVEAVQTAVKQSCDAVAACGLVSPSSCTDVMPRSLTDCLREELTLYECIIADPCDSLTACEAQSAAMQACFIDNGTLPPVSGIAAFDRATQVCQACASHGAACGNSFDCFSYALCIDDCAGDGTCEDPCAISNPTGAGLYQASLDCQAAQCN